MDQWLEFLLEGSGISSENSRGIACIYPSVLLSYQRVNTMKYFCCLLAFTFFQDVPLKPKEEFEVKLDYEFRQRPVADRNTVHLGTPVRNTDIRGSAGVLPYLVLNIRLLHLVEQKMRVQVGTNLDARHMSKKLDVNEVVSLDLGFTDDMVDRVSAHEYTLLFLNSEREPVDKILITVEEDGSFIVNGEKRGKF